MKYAVAIELSDDTVLWREFRSSAVDIDMVRTLVVAQFGTEPLQITRAEDGETLFRRRPNINNGRTPCN